MTRIPRRVSGQLVPGTLGNPGNGRPPLPQPTPRGEDLRRSDFIAMPAPAVYYPDRVLNLQGGGVTRLIQPKHTITIAASGTQRAIIDTGLEYDQYVIGATGLMIPTGGPGAGIPSLFYLVDVKRRNMGAQNQTDQGFVAFSSVFGNGIYPHFFSIPLPLPNNTQYLFEFRNQSDLELELDINFIVIAKQAMSRDRIDVHH